MKNKKLVFRFLGLLNNNRRNRKKAKMVMRKFRQLNPNWLDSLKFDLEKETAEYSYVSPVNLKTVTIPISGFVLDSKS